MSHPSPDRVPPVLEAREVGYVYGGKRPVVAVDGVTLRLFRGEVAALLGPNGSGKSTLLRMLCGILSPSRGTVRLDGDDVHRLSARERARKIAFVPQQVRVDFPFTVREVVMMGRAPHQGRLGLERKGDGDVVDEAMDCMRVRALAERRMTELSGGEAQRVMLAQALAQEPQLLMLDEPTSHLDINFQAEIMDLLDGMHVQGKLTVLLSLHDLNLASLYCQRVFMLNRGRLQGEGRPAEVITVQRVQEVYGAHVRLMEPRTEGGAAHVAIVPRRALQKEDGSDSNEKS